MDLCIVTSSVIFHTLPQPIAFIQNLETQKAQAMKEMSDKMVQSVTQVGQLTDSDAKRIIKVCMHP